MDTSDLEILNIIESIISENGKSVPKCYHITLIQCYRMGGDLKELLNDPTFEIGDINKLYWELKKYATSRYYCFSETIIH